MVTEYRIELTLLEPMLGTVPKSEEVYADYIASKAPEDTDVSDELETVEKIEARGWTGFHCDENGPFVYDYVIKGFLKEACGTLRRVAGTLSNKVRAYKKIVDGLAFVRPRRIHLELPEGAELGVLERPLRAMTMQGERVTLARSDTAPAGTKLTFTVRILGEVSEDLLTEWLDYGELRGLGQWRNASYGAFKWRLLE